MTTLRVTANIINGTFCVDGAEVPVVCDNTSLLGYGYFALVDNLYPNGCGGFLPIGSELQPNMVYGQDAGTFLKLLHIQWQSKDYWIQDTIENFRSNCQCTPNPDGGGVIISRTYAEVMTLIEGAGLVPDAMYNITDRGDAGLFFTAISTTELSKEGYRKMLCPSYYDAGTDLNGNVWIGVWNNGKTVNVDELTIWGGQVWKNLDGTIGTSSDSVSLDASWELIPKSSFTNVEYTELQFFVSYDIVNDWIEWQKDGYGNEFGMSFSAEAEYYNFGFNVCDVSDWNINYDLTKPRLFINKCLGVYNNYEGYIIFGNVVTEQISGNIDTGLTPYIHSNIITGEIANNTVSNIYTNTNNGSIYSNVCNDIVLNSNTGTIGENTNNGDIKNNSNVGDISQNSNDSHIYYNSNNGNIFSNSCTGVIYLNSNGGFISSNSGTGSISRNSNNGNINDNSNTGLAVENSNNGSISTNTNAGPISQNSNGGDISGNSIDGGITNNINNGDIINASSSNPCNIQNNDNNGTIGSMSPYVASIVGTIVNL